MYLKRVFFLGLFLCIYFPGLMSQGREDDGQTERAYLVSAITKMADPLFTALSQNKLKLTMPVEKNDGMQKGSSSTYLEGFGRLLAGMAPWLELGPDNTAEGRLRKKYIDLALLCLRNGTDTSSPDYLNFTTPGQSLVDAAFLTHALLRAPKQLWGRLDTVTKQNIITALQKTRATKPGQNNWLLFAGMVEAGLLEFTGECDQSRIDYSIEKHKEWYKGDGIYGDGVDFHWDYYNSYVIQPMMLDILRILEAKAQKPVIDYQTVIKRAVRYAAVQERMISPEATYPVLGRSLAYRFGAFQLLSQMALRKELPEQVSPQQVRAALFTMIKKQLEAPGTFDKDGWLQIGIYGHQPGIAEYYISTGSLYLCSQAFLILGLPPTDELWKGKDEDWTAKKVWKGLAVPIDHALNFE